MTIMANEESPDKIAARGSALPPLARKNSPAQAAGFYRTMLGEYEITVVLDGTDPFPLEKLLIDSDPNEVHRTLEQSGLEASVETSINTFLINTGDHLILVDAGVGQFFGDHCGKLVINLAAAGYVPEQIDTILLTHIHPDHTGGLAADGRMIFPNATIHVNKADMDYWFDSAQEAKADAEHKKMFEQSQLGLRPYIAADRIKTFIGGESLSSGITTIPAPGHTVGHTLFRIESKGEVIVLFGDIVHSGDVQMPHPGVAIKLDSDSATAAAVRRKVLSEYAQNRTLIGGSHLSFPGLGHVRKEGDGYVWLPLAYNSHPATVKS